MWNSLPPPAWRQLSRNITGPLLLPGEEQFDTLRRPATNRYQSASPQAIARCATPTDVAQVINFSRRYGLGIAVRGAGHSFANHSSTTGLLIATGLMCTVAVDGDAPPLEQALVSRRSTGHYMITKPPSPPAADQPSASPVSLWAVGWECLVEPMASPATASSPPRSSLPTAL